MTAPTRIEGKLSDSFKLVNQPIHDYHCDLLVQSCSLLKAALVSPAHYEQQFTEPPKTSKQMDMGSLLHTLVLEPSQLPFQYAIFPGERDGRDKDFKQFVQASGDRVVIDELELHEARMLAERVLHRRIRLSSGDGGREFGAYLAESEREVSVYYTDPGTGMPCRVRFDALHPDIIFDLKKSVDVTRSGWLRSALGFHYDMQAYMYSLAESLFNDRTHPLPFVFVAGELARPHSVSVFQAGDSFLKEGAAKYQRAISAVAACRATEVWPDQGEDAVLELDPWMVSSDPGWRGQLERIVS